MSNGIYHLDVLMESPIWYDVTNMGQLFVQIMGLQVIVSKLGCISVSEEIL